MPERRWNTLFLENVYSMPHASSKCSLMMPLVGKGLSILTLQLDQSVKCKTLYDYM